MVDANLLNIVLQMSSFLMISKREIIANLKIQDSVWPAVINRTTGIFPMSVARFYRTLKWHNNVIS